MPHTPGPWRAIGGLVLANHPDFPEVKGESLVIADSLSEDLEADVITANASLIAAAPDLLALCKLSLESLFSLGGEHYRGRGCFGSGVQDGECMCTACQLRRVIARAEGS